MLGVDVYRPRRQGAQPARAEMGQPVVDAPEAASTDGGSAAADTLAASPESPAAGAPAPIADMGWEALADLVSDCTRCELCQGRTQTVFEAGARTADLMIIGEAPGREEDRRGEPFVGRAGQLLDQMLFAIGRDRASSVYITNIVKCRPPRNRDPEPGEAAACRDYLSRQIALVRPSLILAAGRVAAQNLLQSNESLGRLRGRCHETSEGVPVLVTYHPAYLLRYPGEKRKVWEDLKLARDRLKSAA
jgi:DNA polymerase